MPGTRAVYGAERCIQCLILGIDEVVGYLEGLGFFFFVGNCLLANRFV